MGVKGIVFDGDKCLIVKKVGSRKEFWDLPGGRMEQGESVLRTLDRELREELPSLGAYEVERLVDVYPLPFDLPEGPGLMFVAFKINAAPFSVVLSPEHSEYLWVTKAEFEALKAGPVPTDYHYDAILKAFS